MKEKLKRLFRKTGVAIGNVADDWSQAFLTSLLLANLFWLLVVYRGNIKLLYSFVTFFLVIYAFPALTLDVLRSKKYSLKFKNIVRYIFILLNVAMMVCYMIIYPTVELIAVPVTVVLYAFMLAFSQWFNDHRYHGLSVRWLEKVFEKIPHIVIFSIFIIPITAMAIPIAIMYNSVIIGIVLSLLLVSVWAIARIYVKHTRYESIEDIMFFKFDEGIPK